jgi:hypothetical protein
VAQLKAVRKSRDDVIAKLKENKGVIDAGCATLPLLFSFPYHNVGARLFPEERVFFAAVKERVGCQDPFVPHLRRSMI